MTYSQKDNVRDYRKNVSCHIVSFISYCRASDKFVKMDSLNDTQFYVERRDYISDNFTTIFTETNEYYNALEEWMWRLEEKLGLSSKHGVVIFMLFYLILLLTLTLCVLCFYSCIILRRHRLNSEKNKAEGRSNYTKNIHRM